MDEREAFLEWFATTWREAERALHGGEATQRLEIWSRTEPVTLFGAWMSASGVDEVRNAFRTLADSFGGATASEIELIAADVSGDLAYTVHREITSAVVDGAPRDYVLRVTQVYRCEDGDWRVVHRHGDEEQTLP
ncbi:nuclear transport factor 2 family protein [Microbacterium sp. NPDC057650]|uniref:nuclear transport factor 2 family protein n=1 Tax=unclassified Microbacterium TaxID=2609290 RepID=UPI003672BC8B